jgi:7-cyano-7-deazaguanine synthase in queuosine biosynthesis
MRLTCAPLDYDFGKPRPGELQVILYGYADRNSRGKVGANIREIAARKKLKPASRAWDFLSTALAVIAADTGVSRSQSPDGWTRTLDLRIAVADPGFWDSHKSLLKSALCFLTTDIWELTFLEGGVYPTPPKIPSMPNEDCVSLLSGGLDSLIGALDLTARDGKRPYLVSQVSQGDKEKQAYFASKIAGGLSHLQLNHVARLPTQNERSQRARSIIFLAYGVLMATALKGYHQGEVVPLYVCENGFISINPPLTAGRLGSLSTRTTHPVFLGLIQQLLDAAGLRIKIENPYQLMTKGEMLLQSADQGFLQKYAHQTTSCGRYARNAYTHCGRCVPCLIRRAAFKRWNRKDKTGYVYDDLSKNDADHARFDDVRAAGMAVATTKAEGLDAWIGSSLTSSFISDPSSYKATLERGLKELERFLRSQGVT